MGKKAGSAKPRAIKKTTETEEALSAHDQKLLSDAVSFVNTRLDKASSSLIEIGQYLLDKFFGGDIEKAQERAPRKGVSLRKLAEHPDIGISFAGLSNAVNLAVQEKEIGSVKASEQLTPSHKVLLLKVPELATKKKYIEKVANDGLSVRKFQDLLEKDGYAKPRGLAAIESEAERKKLRSGFQKYVGPFEEIADMDLEKLFEMPARDIKAAYNAAQKAMERLSAIVKELAKHVD